jgi:hypothetical protein
MWQMHNAIVCYRDLCAHFCKALVSMLVIRGGTWAALVLRAASGCAL